MRANILTWFALSGLYQILWERDLLKVRFN